MKPILFNTEMVRAILDGRKTVTRRVVKFRHGFNPYWSGYVPDGVVLYGSNNVPAAKAPYRPGDILYVRETWATWSPTYGTTPEIIYKADGYSQSHKMKWRPSIHMPREAARIFLRVTDIKVQRVQDITDEEAQKEGVKGWMVATDRDWDKNPNFVIAFRHVWNNCYSKPQPVKTKGVITHYESYPWEDIQETRTYRGKPWYVIGNPWVWVIEFERCEKPERGT